MNGRGLENVMTFAELMIELKKQFDRLEEEDARTSHPLDLWYSAKHIQVSAKFLAKRLLKEAKSEKKVSRGRRLG